MTNYEKFPNGPIHQMDLSTNLYSLERYQISWLKLSELLVKKCVQIFRISIVEPCFTDELFAGDERAL